MAAQGLVYVFTGDGKGKTSAALGVAVRAIGAGMKAGWVAWYKQESWGLSDAQMPKLVGEDRFQMYFLGKGFNIKNYESRIKNNEGKEVKFATVGNGGKVVDTATEAEHIMAAQAALETAQRIISEVDVLVMDEVNNAVADNLIDPIDLIDLISKRGKTHLMLTGRDAHVEIVALADLVTEMKKVKHPYDEGKLAVKGLDF